MAGLAIIIVGLRASWIAAAVIMFLSGVLLVLCAGLLEREPEGAPSARRELLERCLYFFVGGAFGVLLGVAVMVTMVVWGHPNWELARPLINSTMSGCAILGFALPRLLAWTRHVLELLGIVIGGFGG